MGRLQSETNYMGTAALQAVETLLSRLKGVSGGMEIVNFVLALWKMVETLAHHRSMRSEMLLLD